MSHTARRTSRPIAWALTGAFAVLVSANCVTHAEMTEAEMACCVTMGSECGHRAQEQEMSCCSSDVQGVDQSTAAKSITIPLPDVVAGSLVVFADTPLQSPIDRGHHFDGFTPKPPGVPRYLLAATFLI